MKIDADTYEAALLEYRKKFGEEYPTPFSGGDPDLIYSDILKCLKSGKPTKQEDPAVSISWFGVPDRRY